MTRRRSVIILYEDAERTMKFIEQMSSCPQFSHITVHMLNAGVDCGIIASPPIEDKANKDIVFSRCSGSYASRNHQQSPILIESVIFAAEHSNMYTVLNGSKAFRLEMNKMLAFLYISGEMFQDSCAKLSPSKQSHLKVPTTVAVTKIESKLVRNALIKHNIKHECFIKGIVGGGSTTVRRLTLKPWEDNVNSKESQHMLNSQLDIIRSELNSPTDIFIIQQKAPNTESECQYRFEIINKQVHYVVKIRQKRSSDDVNSNTSSPHNKNNRLDNQTSAASTHVKNLCMCDLEVNDPEVELSIINSPIELSKEPGMQGCLHGSSALKCARGVYTALELFAHEHNLHVVALEGTLHKGVLWTFDINTNSNYNHKLEHQYGVVPGAWQVLQTMIT